MVSSSPVKNTATRSLRLTGSFGQAYRCRQAQFLAAQAHAGRQDHAAVGDILAGAAHPFT
jgi:hypothetical protein